MSYNNRESRESNQMVFGIRAVIEAIRSDKEIESLYIQRGIGGGLLNELKELMHEYEYGIVAQQVPVEKLNRLTQKNHQGAIAFISPIIYQKIENIIPEIFERGEVPLILVLDGITDVRNMGAIARTAECAGVHAIVIPAKGSAQQVPYIKSRFAGTITLCKPSGFCRNQDCNWYAAPRKLKMIFMRLIIHRRQPLSWVQKKTAYVMILSV
jgi:23S rRNA (guanosine2251-2'-O)-methyltransferase